MSIQTARPATPEEEAFAAYLAECRQKAGVNQTTVGDATGVSQQSVTKWERAESLPSPRRFRGLVRSIDADLQRLWQLYLAADESRPDTNGDGSTGRPSGRSS